MSGERSAIRVVVRGRVQGVGDRAWTQHQAELHDLTGWVRNLSDGAVEAVLIGPAEPVGTMIRAMAEGPRGAAVESLEEYPASREEAGSVARAGFEIRRSADPG